jgi:acyl-CoA synthetase (AMP-forming)/AMP-acid ligase II
MLPDIPVTLGDLIERNAQLYGDRLAVIDHEAEFSHCGFRDRGTAIARALVSKGVRKQDRVVILMRNSVTMLTVFAATELTGIIAVPLNWRLSEDELQRIVADCSPTCLVYEPRFADLARTLLVESSIVHVVTTGPADPFAPSMAQWIDEADPRADLPSPLDQDIAYLIYTSGSSGRPKGVMLTHHSQMAAIHIAVREMRMETSDHALIGMPLFHVGAKLWQQLANVHGGSAYIMEQFDPALAGRLIEQRSITWLPLVPTMLDSLLDAGEVQSFDVSSVRMIVYTGARMPLVTIKRAIDRFGPLFLQMYGQTENMACVPLRPEDHRISGERRDAVLQSVGRPGPMAAVAIVDHAGRAVKQGVPGDIFIKSEAVMLGYWNDMATTLETIRDGWVKTGDVGYIDEYGYLTISGRSKDMIITGGENVFAGEVEEAIRHHPSVSDAAVIGVPDERWGESVAAFVKLRVGAVLSEQELVEFCLAKIARYKRPRIVRFIDVMPVNGVGKPDKNALRAAITITLTSA